MYSTQVSRHVSASRPAVYRALLDAGAIARWRVPAGLSSPGAFDAREGGGFRVSLTYDAPAGTGKSAPHTDTYHGHFVKLVPDEQVVDASSIGCLSGRAGVLPIRHEDYRRRW